MSMTTYSYGMPFSEWLGKNLEDQYIRVKKNNKASLIIIDGAVGEGKTTLAIQCADYINKLDGKEEVNIKSQDQYGMGGSDFLKKLRICYQKKLPVCIYDEAGDFAKRASLTRFNAMLNRTFETFRAFKIVVIIVLPSFSVLDNDIFDKGIPQMLVNTYGRDNNSGNFRVFDFARMMYIRHYMKKEVIKKKVYGKVYPNIYGHFKNLSNKRSKELDFVSTQGKLEELQASEVKIEGLIGVTDIAKRLVRSVSWVYKAVSITKFKPNRIIGNKKYYDESILDVLGDMVVKENKRLAED